MRAQGRVRYPLFCEFGPQVLVGTQLEIQMALDAGMFRGVRLGLLEKLIEAELHGVHLLGQQSLGLGGESQVVGWRLRRGWLSNRRREEMDFLVRLGVDSVDEQRVVDLASEVRKVFVRSHVQW